MGVPPWGFLIWRGRLGRGGQGGNQHREARHALCRHKPQPIGWAGVTQFKDRLRARRSLPVAFHASAVTASAPLQQEARGGGGWRDGRHQFAILAAGVTPPSRRPVTSRASISQSGPKKDTALADRLAPATGKADDSAASCLQPTFLRSRFWGICRGVVRQEATRPTPRTVRVSSKHKSPRPTDWGLAHIDDHLAHGCCLGFLAEVGPNLLHFLLQSHTIIDLQTGYVVEGQGGLTSGLIGSMKRDDLNLLACTQHPCLEFRLLFSASKRQQADKRSQPSHCGGLCGASFT